MSQLDFHDFFCVVMTYITPRNAASLSVTSKRLSHFFDTMYWKIRAAALEIGYKRKIDHYLNNLAYPHILWKLLLRTTGACLTAETLRKITSTPDIYHKLAVCNNWCTGDHFPINCIIYHGISDDNKQALDAFYMRTYEILDTLSGFTQMENNLITARFKPQGQYHSCTYDYPIAMKLSGSTIDDRLDREPVMDSHDEILYDGRHLIYPDCRRFVVLVDNLELVIYPNILHVDWTLLISYLTRYYVQSYRLSKLSPLSYRDWEGLEIKIDGWIKLFTARSGIHVRLLLDDVRKMLKQSK